METLMLPFSPRYIVLTICSVVTALLLGIGIVDHKVFDLVLIPILIFGALTLLGIRDLTQKGHAVLRNYPISAHLRFLLEEIRPEMRQYFFESEKDGMPFSRDTRAVIYQRAKMVLDKRPFGTQEDVYRDGYEWIHHSVAGNFIPVGHGDDHYLILEKSINDQYMATKFRAWSPQVVQQLGVQLASPADRAAWQRAGSPTTWHVDQEYGLDTPQGPSMENLFAVKAGRDPLPFDMGATSTNKPFVIGNSVLSARQLLALPASPASLRRLLLGGGDGGWPGGDSSYLFQTVPMALDLPVIPAVRAALYRLLASLPGGRRAGQV